MLGNLKIGTRLALGFGLIVLLILVMVFFTFRGVSEMQQSTNRLANGATAKYMAASEALAQMQEVVRSVGNIVILQNASAQQKEQEKIKAARAKYGEAMKRLKELHENSAVKHPKETEILTRMIQGIKPAAEANNSAVTLALAGKRTEAEAILAQEAIPRCDSLFTAFHDMADYQRGRVAERYQQTVDTAASTRWILGVGSTVVVVLAVILALVMTLGITRPLSALLAMLKDVAHGDGDLTRRLDES